MKTAAFLFTAAVMLAQSPDYAPAHTLKGHTRFVASVAFTPDGQRLATGSWDGTIKFWQVDKGEQLFTLNAHELPITSIAFSPDGKVLASGSDDCTIKLWDVGTRRLAHTLRGHNSYVMALAFSPDGRWLASGSAYGSIRIWDVAKAKEARILEAHEMATQSVAFSPDGRLLASAGRKGAVKIWDTASWQVLHEYADGFPNPRAVVFSADGRLLATANPSEIRLTDVATGTHAPKMVTRTMQPHMMAIAFSPDGKWIAVGGGPGFIELWDTQTRKRVTTLEGRIGGSAKCEPTATCAVESIAISPDGRWLAAGGDDNTARLWKHRE